MGMWSGVNGKTGGLIVPHLHSQGIISSNMFSFYLTSKAGASYIDFGTPNPAVMSDPDDIVWIEVLNEDGNENWWTNKLTAI